MAVAVDSFKLFVDQVITVGRENLNYAFDVVTIIGTWYALRFTFDLGYHTLLHCKRSLFSPKNFVKFYGKWAVVSGCTSGLGKQFCRQLANRGLNIVLIGRNKELVYKESRYLENRYGIHTIVIIHDFQAVTGEDYAKITELLQGREIGVLVNNAGVHYDYPMHFSEVDPDRIQAITQVNMAGVVMLTRAIVPIMIQRKRGLIVNLSSGAGWFPMPLISLYSASKGFVTHFSQSLNLELKQHNILVQSLEPLYINTRMSRFSNLLRLTSPDAKTYVRNCLKSLGRSSQTTGYYPHVLQMLIIKWCPLWLSTRVSFAIQHYLNVEGSRSKLKVD